MSIGRLRLFSLWLLILCGCAVNRKAITDTGNEKTGKEDLLYYHLFTDGMRVSLIAALFSNSSRSISYFNECIRLFPERSAPYYQISTVYSRTHDYNRALRYAMSAYSRDSVNTWYILNLANIYQNLSNADSASIMYEKYLQHNDDDKIRYNLALNYARSGRSDFAFKALGGLSEENRSSREALLIRHELFHNLGLYDSAVSELKSLIRLFPEDFGNYGLLAEYLTEIGRMDAARKVYWNMLEKDSVNGLIYLSFGDFFMRIGDHDSAFYCYNTGICKNTLSDVDKVGVIISFISDKEILGKYLDKILSLFDCIEKRNCLFTYYAAHADIFITQENYEMAKPYLDSALMYDKSNYLLWEQSLLVNSYSRYYSEVVRIAGECLEYFKDKPTVYLLRAIALKELGFSNDAIVDAKTILSLNAGERGKIQALNILGEIYNEKGLFVDSDKCFEEILRIDKENLVISNNYAYYLAIRGDNLKRAEELSLYTLEIQPNNPTFLDTYGWILFKKGKYNDALRFTESAIRNGAYENSEVLMHYGDIMMELGRCNEALEAYDRASTIDLEISIDDKIDNVKTNCENKK
jgi:tetratricopeptide (TPR) repeat protein